ncbi:uncharacterized protein LOC118166182 isoform X2 [Oxyura jamaicensis]|uniref:uncharacterized protein LOC118166182 isoform X2 n=1 Tax=Oxyura jamaicensis TaxID=8884 RepID=UPI0015A699D0|nr:uncharacterized protein LOC118166182 isoform X2 [Oxyura jamaicensis]
MQPRGRDVSAELRRCLPHPDAGRNLGFLLEIPQDSVNGTVGQSVLLPVSYRFNSTPRFPVPIQWTFGHPSQLVISCTLLICSLGAGGALESCSTKCFPYAAHAGRVELFPESASLLLRDLRLSDSGVYNVSFAQQRQSRHITLTVLEQPVPTGPSCAGRNLGFLLEIPQDSVNGTMGQSVLLPVSYRFNSTLCFPVPIQWTFGHPSQLIISCTVLNCSLGAGGALESCSTKCFPHPAHAGRVELFPENASLLLRDLRLSDSGVYNVNFAQQRQSRHITLTVLEQPVTLDPSSEGTSDQDHTQNYMIGACSSIFLLLLLLVFCIWRWGRWLCSCIANSEVAPLVPSGIRPGDKGSGGLWRGSALLARIIPFL